MGFHRCLICVDGIVVVWMVTIMRVWLSYSGSDYQSGQSDEGYKRNSIVDCDSDCVNPLWGRDCDSDCVNPLWGYASITFPLIDIDIHRKSLLEQSSALYIQECTTQRWLVGAITGSGRLAVVDQDGLFLLQLFRSPLTLAQAIEALPHWRSETVEKGVMLFYTLGLLRKNNEACEAPVPAQSERLTAWMHVTNACNLRCDYCYLQKTQEHMSDNVGRRAVDAVFRSARHQKMRRVMLKYAGGEASLHMANVLSLHEYAVQQAQRYNILLEAVLLSNGVVLSQRIIDQLKKHQIAISISLDGLGTYHDQQRPFVSGVGSSRYVLRTIDRLLANQVVPHISITVSHRNLQGLPELIRYVLEHDLPFSLSYYRDNECSTSFTDLRFADEQMIAAMRAVFEVIETNLPSRSLLGCLLDKANLHAPHQQTCSVGQSYMVIDQHGGVAKCQMDMQHMVTTIEADDPLRVIRNDRQAVQNLPVDEKEGCRSCEWRYWCTGGCPLLTYRATGRYDVKSPNCAIYKALFPEVVRLEALRLLHYATPIILNECVSLSVPALT
jgi:uncharacterized protein